MTNHWVELLALGCPSTTDSTPSRNWDTPSSRKIASDMFRSLPPSPEFPGSWSTTWVASSWAYTIINRFGFFTRLFPGLPYFSLTVRTLKRKSPFHFHSCSFALLCHSELGRRVAVEFGYWRNWGFDEIYYSIAYALAWIEVGWISSLEALSNHVSNPEELSDEPPGSVKLGPCSGSSLALGTQKESLFSVGHGLVFETDGG